MNNSSFSTLTFLFVILTGFRNGRNKIHVGPHGSHKNLST